MTAELVELRPVQDCHDIAKALRNIADDVEAGLYSFEPTLAVVVLAREGERHDRSGPRLNFAWQTHGLGQCSYFAAKGVLASALGNMEGPDT